MHLAQIWEILGKCKFGGWSIMREIITDPSAWSTSTGGKAELLGRLHTLSTSKPWSGEAKGGITEQPMSPHSGIWCWARHHISRASFWENKLDDGEKTDRPADDPRVCLRPCRRLRRVPTVFLPLSHFMQASLWATLIHRTQPSYANLAFA